MFKVIIKDTNEEVSRAAFNVMKEVLDSKPNPVLGLATGSSPVGLYKEMIKDHEETGRSYKDIITFNLDEYVGIPRDHEQSYYTFMHENLFNYIDCPEENIHVPEGNTDDHEKACVDYENALKQHVVDIQVLGIGNNGHIGFNEPSDVFSKGTGLVNLTDSTIDANKRFFASRDEVPTQALSMGVGQIMNADSILLLAMGKGKAEILEKSLFGDVTPQVPASILQFFKGNVYVCADEEALSVIMERHPEAVTK